MLYNFWTAFNIKCLNYHDTHYVDITMKMKVYLDKIMQKSTVVIDNKIDELIKNFIKVKNVQK